MFKLSRSNDEIGGYCKMTPDETKEIMPKGEWYIGKYATYIFYITTIIVLALGFFLGIIFHPIIYR